MSHSDMTVSYVFDMVKLNQEKLVKKAEAKIKKTVK